MKKNPTRAVLAWAVRACDSTWLSGPWPGARKAAHPLFFWVARVLLDRPAFLAAGVRAGTPSTQRPRRREAIPAFFLARPSSSPSRRRRRACRRRQRTGSGARGPGWCGMTRWGARVHIPGPGRPKTGKISRSRWWPGGENRSGF